MTKTIAVTLTALLAAGSLGCEPSSERISPSDDTGLEDVVLATEPEFASVDMNLTRDTVKDLQRNEVIILDVDQGYIVSYYIDIGEGLKRIRLTETYQPHESSDSKRKRTEEIHDIVFNQFLGIVDGKALMKTIWYKEGQVIASEEQIGADGKPVMYPLTFGAQFQVLQGQKKPGEYTYHLFVETQYRTYEVSTIVIVKDNKIN